MNRFLGQITALAWPFLACLVAAGTGGCASDSGFFRLRNPFPDETRAVSTWLDDEPPAEQPRLKSRERRRKSRERAPDPSPSPYFGRPEGTPEAAPVPDASAGGSPRSAAVEPHREATLSPPPATARTGVPCYRCNGKGYHLNSLEPGAEFVTCEDCHGTGRR